MKHKDIKPNRCIPWDSLTRAQRELILIDAHRIPGLKLCKWAELTIEFREYIYDNVCWFHALTRERP